MDSPPRSRSGARAWAGAILRILAYSVLLIVLYVPAALLWSLLPQGVRDDEFLQASMTLVAALAAGAIMLRLVDRRSPAALGIAVSRMTLPHLARGTAIGAAGLAVAVAALTLTGAVVYASQPGTAQAWLGAVAAQLGIFAIAAFAEEAVFRGYAFQVLARVGGPAVATIVTSALFALAHGANPSIGIVALVNIFLAGVLLAIAYLRTLSLWFATAVHLGWNWAMATLFDLPVSGWTVFDTPLYDAAVRGPSWWSGAEFGPEGGLVGTIGFGVALLAVLRWRAVRPDPAIAAARPLMLRTEGNGDEG